ncbi:MAG: hypothetical protein J5829_09150 [Lachnospiraceae bacterium]|nr:hypothetical protein [Lachnospiraceae bacterium]
MSPQEKAIQLIQEIPESEMDFVICFLKGIVMPEKKLDTQAVRHLIDDLDKARNLANTEGWISEEEFFARQI